MRIRFPGSGDPGQRPARGARASALDLYVRGVAAARAGDTDEARFTLERLLRLDQAQSDARARLTPRERSMALLWLAEIDPEPAAARSRLEEALATDPSNPAARRRLAVLDGRLLPAEIVDPDRLPSPDPPGASSARRFTCPTCGGRMVYTPDGQSLVCEYCARRERREGGAGREIDFTVALARAQGHRTPAAMHTFACQGCGVVFVLGAQRLSITCPHCGSTHVVDQVETRDLVPPTAVVPFAVEREAARQAAEAWAQEHKAHVAPPLGVYLPVWAFDLSGQAPWAGQRHDMFSDRPVPETGVELVLENDVLVSARRAPPAGFERLLAGLDTGTLATYDPAFLADWPAETYDVSVSDAALEARAQTLGRVRKRLTSRLAGQVSGLQVRSDGFNVDSFQLLLVPVWIARLDEGEHAVLVNGRSGEAVGPQAPGGLRHWLAAWLGRG